jgi:type IV pilus assembly protein PilV
MKPIRIPRTAQRGMTLLEVLVAILIFSIGMLGMVGMQARAMQYSVDSEDRTRAAMLANEAVAAMWVLGTVSLDSGTVATWVSRVQNQTASGLPNANGTISAPDANGVVTVSVTWKAPNKNAADADSRYVTQVSMP